MLNFFFSPFTSFLLDYLLLWERFYIWNGSLKGLWISMVLYLVVSDIVKILLKNGEKETLEYVTITTRGEASSAIINRYQMAIEATAGINIQTLSPIWCKIMGTIRMAGNWILFLDVDLFTERRSLEVLQSIYKKGMLLQEKIKKGAFVL